MKHRTAELEGALLDAAVAKAEGHKPYKSPYNRRLIIGYSTDAEIDIPAYSMVWTYGGPIIERERIVCVPVWAGVKLEPYLSLTEEEMTQKAWEAMLDPGVTHDSTFEGNHHQYGQTPLIAAMRAYVASKFGEEVELP